MFIMNRLVTKLRQVAALAFPYSLVSKHLLRETTIRQASEFTSRNELIKSLFAYIFVNYEQSDQNYELLEFLRFYAAKFSQSNSQWGQDIFVTYITNEARGLKFLEIGGADGLTHSNTLLLSEKYQWSGVLVEPDRDQFALLSQIRKESACLNAAISPDKSLTPKYLPACWATILPGRA